MYSDSSPLDKEARAIAMEPKVMMAKMTTLIIASMMTLTTMA